MEPIARDLRVALLGRPEATFGDQRLEFPTRKGLALLCFLAARQEPVERTELATMFWPGSAAALGNLRWEPHNLRQLPGADDWLLGNKQTLQVLAHTDLAAARAAFQDGRHEQVIGLTREPLLDGLSLPQATGFQEWLTDEQARLDGLRRQSLQSRTEELEAAGQLSEARALVEQLIESDPLDETAYRTAMRLAFRQGDLAAATGHYDHCRRILAQELGLEPTAETQELAAAIEKSASSSTPGRSQRLPPELLRPPELVGRQRDWDRLQAAWDQHHIIFISGRPGIGKTRLAQDFLRAQVGGDVAVLRGHSGDQQTLFSSYARGWRGVFNRRPELRDELPEWVQEQAARFLPEVFSHVQPAIADSPEDIRFARAMVELYRQLLSQHGAALVDDIQYFDPVSWRLGGLALQELSAEMPDLPGRMVITFRTDEMPAAFLTGLNGLVAGHYASHIELEPLDEAALSQLISSLGRPAREAGRFRSLTGGNPFFVLELLRRVHTDPGLELVSPAGQLLPDSVHHAIQARLDRLPAAAVRLAGALAVLGDHATIERLAIMAETDVNSTQEALDLLAANQLISGLGFVHDLLLEAVNRGLSDAERRRLEARFSRLSASGPDFQRPSNAG